MGLLNPIKTLYYGLIIRIKLGWFLKKERKMKKIAEKILLDKFAKEKIDQNTLDKISNNYLSISNILLDRKNMKAALSIPYLDNKRKDTSN